LSLSEFEQLELMKMTEALDAANLDRIKALIQLATIRQMGLDVLMNQFSTIKNKKNGFINKKQKYSIS
jgi:hypothetical protein